MIEPVVTTNEVHAMTVDHQKHVRKKISDLRKLERALADLAAQCALGDVPECAIVETLYGPQ